MSSWRVWSPGWFCSLLLPAVVLVGCGDLGDFDRVKEDFHYSYAMDPGGRLDFDNRNGSVELAGWDRSTIDVSGTKSAPSREALRDVQIKVTVNGGNAVIATSWPENFRGGYGVKFLVRVPRKTSLGRAQTTNGGVSIEDLEGGGTTTSTNGRIFLARTTGDFEARSTNASIEFDDCSGNMRAESTNGSIRARLKSGVVDARSSNGPIDLTLLSPPGDKSIRARTTNGSVTVALAEFHNNSVSMETTNGSVTVRLPPDTDARLIADTSNANITNDLTLESHVESSRHHMSGNLGKGGPLISAHTSTGSIHIAKY